MKKFNPSYCAKMNEESSSFTIVAHVPELPVASEEYKDKIYYLKSDTCFYHCLSLSGEWVWERVTFGIHRQFVLPIAWIVPGATGYTFNDEVNTLKNLITEMAKYDTFFTNLKSNNSWLNTNSGATLNRVIAVSNKVIGWVNRTCSSNIDLIQAGGVDTSTPDGATCQELATRLNELIGVLNPHAGFSYEVSRIDTELARLSGLVSSPYSFVETTDTTPVVDKIYYVKSNGIYKLAGDGNNPTGKIESFTSGTKYYEVTGGVTVATPQDFNALSVTVGSLSEELHAFKADTNAEIQSASQSIRALSTSLQENTAGINRIDADIEEIVETYIGWNGYTSTNKRTIIARLADIEFQIGTTENQSTLASRLSGVESSLTSVGNSITALGENVDALTQTIGNQGSGLVKQCSEMSSAISEEKTARENKDAEHTVFVSKFNALKASLTTISGISISNDAGFAEVCAAIRTIKSAATSALNALNAQEST